MRDIKTSGWDRRDFFRIAAAAVAAQRTGEPAEDVNTADILVETLIDWGATHAFGIVGGGINSIIEALRKRPEAAAFMASGWAKHTGRLGVSIGTTGAGAIHLMNGLSFHDPRGVRFQRGVDTVKLMEPLAVCNQEVASPEHAIVIGNRACRAALGDRGVAHVAISKDVQMMKRSADKRSMRNPCAVLLVVGAILADAVGQSVARRGRYSHRRSRVAVLVGQGGLTARDEVTRLADVLGAPVAKALFGMAGLPDDSPFTTGEIGDLGTTPSPWAMKNCDTVLIRGSTMPWEEYLSDGWADAGHPG